MRDVWGIHDFVPDYSAFSSLERFLATPADKVHGGPSGCGYYRIVAPLDALREHGWDTAYDFGTPPADPGRIVVAQRMDRPEALPTWRRMLARHKLVYEIDDDVFSVEKVNWMAYRTYAQGVRRDAVEQGATVASLVTVTTEPLAEVMRQFNPTVAVIPNVVPEGVLGIERPRHPGGKVVIGWQGGASHGQDIALIAPTLRHVLDRNRDATLHVMGTDFRTSIGRPARYTNWIPVDASLRYFRAIDFDVALAPLTGTVFDASKSAIKAIEANALGIPVLASDATPYRDFIRDGVNGYLCRTRADWGKRLAELVNDGAAREEMGAAGKRIVAESHTMGTGWRRWAEAYASLLGSNPPAAADA